MDEPKTEQDWLQLELKVSRLFSAAPLRSLDERFEEQLYAGRSSEIQRLMDAVRDPAKHILLYGERGVGKTSISNNFWTNYDKLDQPIIAIRIHAYPLDDFSSLWLRVLEELVIVAKLYCNDLRADFKCVSPDIVKREFQKFRNNLIPIIIIDEFDQLKGEAVRELTANFLKSLHDNIINVTIVLIGVADNVEELIDNHRSLRRVLSLVKLERMNILDLNEILDRRLQLTPLNLSGEARSAMIGLSCGLPYYVQTLGKFAAQNAIRDRRTRVHLEDVKAAIDKFIIESGESFGEAYQRATESKQAGNIFEEMMLACALASSDKGGFFKPLEVAKALNIIITDKTRACFQIQRYLFLFTSEKRGRVLIRQGMETEYRYRFSDATMQPFIIMRAIKEGRIDGISDSILFHWYLGEIRDGRYQLGTAEAYAARWKALAREKSMPLKVPTSPADAPIEAIITPTPPMAIVALTPSEKTGEKSPVPPASGSDSPSKPLRKPIFYRFFRKTR